MKNSSLSLCLAAKILLLIILASHDTHGREFHMTGLDITAEIKDDGRMLVQEDREFVFDGEFSEVYRTFPLEGKASFNEFHVSVNGQEYIRAESKAPGTWMIDKHDDHKELRIFIEAKDTQKLFSMRFVVTGATERYEDAMLLYYQLISEQWDQPVENIRARIYPPEPLPADHPRHWVHGTLDAVSEIQHDGIIEVTLDHLPANRFLEIRALYPEGLFPGMPQQAGQIEEEVLEEVAVLVEEANRMREEAIRKEEERAEKTQRMAERHETGKTLAIPLALIVVIIWFWVFRKYRNKPILREKPGAFSGLPDKEPPAMINYLMNGAYINGNALVSTLFDLAHRGILKIEERDKDKKPLFGKAKPDVHFVLSQDAREREAENLLPYEKKLLRFLFDDLAETPGEISLKRMKKKSTRMQKFFSSWTKSVKRHGKRKEWFDKKSVRGQYIGIIAGATLFVTFLVLAVLVYGPWLLIPAGTAFVSALASFAIAHRTYKGEKAYQQWKYLRQYLRRYDFESDIHNLDAHTVNGYLIYGLAMGLGPKYFKRLMQGVEAHGHNAYFSWIILHHTSLGSFGETINQVISTTSTTMSSASGMGGGGTAGGGGGAASGGGGAR